MQREKDRKKCSLKENNTIIPYKMKSKIVEKLSRSSGKSTRLPKMSLKTSTEKMQIGMKNFLTQFVSKQRS